MIGGKINTKTLFDSLDDSANSIIQLMGSVNEKQINAIPFKNSWTAGQLAEHVAKANTGIANALDMEGKPVERDPAEREQELREQFLNFTVKFQSPAFILPTKNFYAKEISIADLKKSLERLKKQSIKTNLSEAINHPAFGEITKLELLHFAKFHTQRHLHQMKNIVQKVKTK